MIERHALDLTDVRDHEHILKQYYMELLSNMFTLTWSHGQSLKGGCMGDSHEGGGGGSSCPSWCRQTLHTSFMHNSNV